MRDVLSRGISCPRGRGLSGLLSFLLAFLIFLPFPVQGQALPSGNLHQQALAHLRKKEIKQGITVLKTILEQDPRDLNANNLMGIALTGAGQIAEANSFFRKVLEMNPDFLPALRNLAANEWALNKMPEATNHFRQVLKSDADDSMANLFLAQLNYSRKRFKQANQHFEKARELVAKDPRIIVSFAQSSLAAGQKQKANALIDQLPPNTDAQSRFQLGLMLAQFEAYGAAARQFELAKGKYPDPYQVGYNLTLAHVREGNHAAAIQAAQEVFDQGNHKAELYNLVSQAYEANGQIEEAYEALRQATKIDRYDEENYLDLSALCLAHNDYALAEEIGTIGLQYLPNSDRLYVQRGAARAMRGQFKGASEDFDQATRLAPGKGLPITAHALVLLQLNDLPQARAVLKGRLKEDSEDALAHYLYAKVLLRSGPQGGSVEEQEALESLKNAVRLDPSFAHSHTELGKMLLKQGDLDEAIARLETAIELDPSETTPFYHLAQAYRRRGDGERAKQLLARVVQGQRKDRDDMLQRQLIQIVGKGSTRPKSDMK